MLIEDVYRLNLATYRANDNSYEFNYNYQWTSSIKSKTVAVREVRLITAPRFLFIEGMYLNDPSTSKTCSIDCPIIVSSGNTLTGSDFRSNVNDLFTSYIGSDGPWTYLDQFRISYNPCSTSLIYSTTDDRNLIIGSASGSGFIIGDDIKAITGINDPQLWIDLSKLTHGDSTMMTIDVSTGLTHFESKWARLPIKIIRSSHGVVAIRFTQVWNRDPLLLKCSFVDLAYDGYLGFTNSIFTPPKRYAIRSTTNKFTIQLFDGVSSKPIVLPTDQKDQVIIEAVMCTS